jgi:hypothetical protein
MSQRTSVLLHATAIKPRLKRRISDRREVTCQRLATLLQTRAGFQSQDHLPRLEAPCSRTSPKLTTPTLKASTAFLRTALFPDHRKGPNHRRTLVSIPSKTIGDRERQALRWFFFVTHSLTGVRLIPSTIGNTSLQQQHRGLPVHRTRAHIQSITDLTPHGPTPLTSANSAKFDRKKSRKSQQPHPFNQPSSTTTPPTSSSIQPLPG